jgi:hypothetical protein
MILFSSDALLDIERVRHFLEIRKSTSGGPRHAGDLWSSWAH